MAASGQNSPIDENAAHVRSWGQPDVIGPKADIDTHAAWLTNRNRPTLSRIGLAWPARGTGQAARTGRPGAIQGLPLGDFFDSTNRR